MNLIQNITKRFHRGYDATDGRGRRRPPASRTSHEDVHADARSRLILSGSTRDLARNFSIAAWAIRKHLDFVADFTFQAKTSDEGFNRYLEQWWVERTKKYNFDVAARHSHRRAIRLVEAGRIVDGDCYWLKLRDGRIQALEGDRIANPEGGDDWVNGVRIDPNTGRALAYGICRRIGNTRKELQRIVPARNVLPHAAYEFRYDQVRGISPITSALNWYRDCYEGFDYALAKMKVGQLFGLQVLTDVGSLGPFTGPGTATYTEDADGDGVNDSAPRIDLKQGPFVTELDPGERIEVVESKTPSAETVEFLKLMVHIALRSLDIPYSFFDESFTNFYGSRGGLIQYLHSCDSKVRDLQEFQDEHFRWRAGIGIETGELDLPSGKGFEFLAWEFVPGGVPWWDPVKEARGQAMGIAMGVTSPQRVCREIGTNFETNIDEIAAAMAYARSQNVPLVFADSSAFRPEITVGTENE